MILIEYDIIQIIINEYNSHNHLEAIYLYYYFIIIIIIIIIIIGIYIFVSVNYLVKDYFLGVIILCTECS